MPFSDGLKDITLIIKANLCEENFETSVYLYYKKLGLDLTNMTRMLRNKTSEKVQSTQTLHLGSITTYSISTVNFISNTSVPCAYTLNIMGALLTTYSSMLCPWGMASNYASDGKTLTPPSSNRTSVLLPSTETPTTLLQLFSSGASVIWKKSHFKWQLLPKTSEKYVSYQILLNKTFMCYKKLQEYLNKNTT